MAIKCKVCDKELDALAGGRCRKCRQLVCESCIETGSAKSAEGLLCTNCAIAEPEAAPITQKAPSPIIIPKNRPALPPWGWIVFGVLMLLIFGGIIYFPAMKARFLGKKLGAQDPDQTRRAAAELARMGGTPALNELVRAAETAESIQTRIIAVDALARIHHRDALPLLKRITTAPDTPVKVRLAAKDAIAMQERLTNK